MSCFDRLQLPQFRLVKVLRPFCSAEQTILGLDCKTVVQHTHSSLQAPSRCHQTSTWPLPVTRGQDTNNIRNTLRTFTLCVATADFAVPGGGKTWIPEKRRRTTQNEPEQTFASNKLSTKSSFFCGILLRLQNESTCVNEAQTIYLEHNTYYRALCATFTTPFAVLNSKSCANAIRGIGFLIALKSSQS